MKVTVVAFTKKGSEICFKLNNSLRELGHETTGYTKYKNNDLKYLDQSLYDFTKNAFEKSNAIIFICAIGIAVRAIAPFIVSKATDPAIVVVDELGENVIPILSGHLGGANELALEISKLIDAKAIITTATDLNNVFAVDVWANKNDLNIDNIDSIKYVSAAILNGEKVGFYSDFPVEGNMNSSLINDNSEVGIFIYNFEESKRKISPFKKTLYMTPKQFVVGIGCRKGIENNILEEAFNEILNGINVLPHLVKIIATIDIKKEEKAIKNLCEKNNYELKTYRSEELASLDGEFTSSKFVESITGVSNVCERAAFIASDFGKIILKKTIKNKVTIAVAVRSWRCKF